jgi:hypothetical protein
MPVKMGAFIRKLEKKLLKIKISTFSKTHNLHLARS